MELYQGIILGIIQGLTEFLPVSSSGHLVLGQIFFGMTESQLSFDISVHMGTLLAVLVVYFSDIRQMITSLVQCAVKLNRPDRFRQQFAEDQNLKLAVYILAGSIPTALIGLILKQYEAVLFSSQTLVGCTLLITGTLLWISRKFYHRPSSDNGVHLYQSVIIGFSQGLAVVPGISRSGTTIAVGMFLGLDRSMAAKFSFLLSIPAIIGAQILGIKDMIEAGTAIDGVTIWATIVSFIVGLAALKLLIRLVHSGRFHLFAPYCWIIGAFVLISGLI